jgi:hypothetical protein
MHNLYNTKKFAVDLHSHNIPINDFQKQKVQGLDVTFLTNNLLQMVLNNPNVY